MFRFQLLPRVEQGVQKDVTVLKIEGHPEFGNRTVLLIPTSLDLRSLIVEIALTSVLDVFQCLVKPELTGSSWIFKPQVRSTDTLNSLCTV